MAAAAPEFCADSTPLAAARRCSLALIASPADVRAVISQHACRVLLVPELEGDADMRAFPIAECAARYALKGAPRCRLRPFAPDQGAFLATGRAATVDRSNSHWLCSSERSQHGECGPAGKNFEPRA